METTHLPAIFLSALALLIVWLASVALTYWDFSRRSLPAPWRILWLAVTILLPVAGFVLYWAVRMGMLLSSPPDQQAGPRWTTWHKRPGSDAAAGSTLAAADLLPPNAGSVHPAPVSARPALLHLAVVAGPEQGRSFVIHHLPAVIGRGADIAASLDSDIGVSRRHAEIYAYDQALHLRDLQSTHGTRLNGILIRDHPIHAGDRLEIGQSVLEICFGGRMERS